MKKITASILESIVSKASINTVNILKGSIRTVISLAGSVSEFTISLTARAFIFPIVNLYTKVTMNRNAKTNVTVFTNVNARVIGDKRSKANVLSTSELQVNSSVTKNAIANIYANHIFGKKTPLGILDLKTLDELDSQSLEDIEFTEGVICNVIKSIYTNINGIFEVSATGYTLKYTKLQDIDNITLGVLDLLTLEEIEEVLN